ncbi:hypothetical protein ABPG74_012741 [Tetrahymena malaccensis]
MIAKNLSYERYQNVLSIVFSIFYYANVALSVYIAEKSKDFTGFFTTYFILYSLDKFMTFVISKAWQDKVGFFAWLLDCFNLGFLAVIYYTKKNPKIFKTIYRLKLLVSIIPMTILQIVYYFNQHMIYRHIIDYDSIVNSQIEIAVLIINMIFIGFAFTNSLEKPFIYYADYMNNVLKISILKYLTYLIRNIIHFISYYGMWAILAQQKFLYYDKLSLGLIVASPTIVFGLIEMTIVQSPVPLLNIFFNHPNFAQKCLKNDLNSLKQNRIRPIKCFLQLLSMILISTFLSDKNPFERSKYVPQNIDDDLKSQFILVQNEIYKFNVLVYAFTIFCLVFNLKKVMDSLTQYWIDEEFKGSLSTIINILLKKQNIRYIYIKVHQNGQRHSSLNEPLLFDNDLNQTMDVDEESNNHDNEKQFQLKSVFLDKLIFLQQQGGFVSINKTILVKPDVFMVDKDIFDQRFMTAYLSKVKQLPLSLCYRLQKDNILEILKSRHSIYGVEQNQNVMNLIINNEQYKHDLQLKFTQNYFDSNLLFTLTFDKYISPELINLPALILYDLNDK